MNMDVNERRLTAGQLAAYGRYLRREERGRSTAEKYLRDAGAFARWLEGRPVTKAWAAAWKEHLLGQGYAPSTINAMLAALNRLFRFLGSGASVG